MRRSIALSLVLVAACDPGVLTIAEDPWYVTDDAPAVDETDVVDDTDGVDSDVVPDTDVLSDTDAVDSDSGGQGGGGNGGSNGGPATPVCGNGAVEVGEGCDDKNRRSGDGCSDACVVEFCGDSVTQIGLGEECDDGNPTIGDGCSDVCRIEVVRCGDRKVDPGEQCDDGNGASRDGCSATCTLEPFVITVVDGKMSPTDGAGDTWDFGLWVTNGDPRVRVTTGGQTVIETDTRWEDTEPAWGDSATVPLRPGGSISFEVIDSDWPFGDEGMCAFAASHAELVAWGNTTHTFTSAQCPELRIGVAFP